MDGTHSNEKTDENKTTNNSSSNLPVDQGAQSNEITLTDRVNSHLLKSFLDRLNTPGSSFPVVERIDCSEEGQKDTEFTDKLPEN